MRRAHRSGATGGEAHAKVGGLAADAVAAASVGSGPAVTVPADPAAGVPASGAGAGRGDPVEIAPGIPKAAAALSRGLAGVRGLLTVDTGGLLAGAAQRLRRRLPRPVRRVLRSGRRQVRAVVGQLSRRWHRSLQLRVIGTTLVISVLVVAVLGVFLIQQIASGLLANERKSALTQTAERAGLRPGPAGHAGPARWQPVRADLAGHGAAVGQRVRATSTTS